MMAGIDLPLILAAAFIATVSPGPATLAIAGTSMNSGRKYGLALASGIFAGSMTWSVSAAFGLGAIMLANAWAFEIARYVGACYLLYLAYLSARSALKPGQATAQGLNVTSLRSAWVKGLALHLTNPKAILFFWRFVFCRRSCQLKSAGSGNCYWGHCPAKLFSLSPVRHSFFRNTYYGWLRQTTPLVRRFVCPGLWGGWR